MTNPAAPARADNGDCGQVHRQLKLTGDRARDATKPGSRSETSFHPYFRHQKTSTWQRLAMHSETKKILGNATPDDREEPAMPPSLGAGRNRWYLSSLQVEHEAATRHRGASYRTADVRMPRLRPGKSLRWVGLGFGLGWWQQTWSVCRPQPRGDAASSVTSFPSGCGSPLRVGISASAGRMEWADIQRRSQAGAFGRRAMVWAVPNRQRGRSAASVMFVTTVVMDLTGIPNQA